MAQKKFTTGCLVFFFFKYNQWKRICWVILKNWIQQHIFLRKKIFILFFISKNKFLNHNQKGPKVLLIDSRIEALGPDEDCRNPTCLFGEPICWAWIQPTSRKNDAQTQFIKNSFVCLCEFHRAGLFCMSSS